jgi:hypothetical protein
MRPRNNQALDTTMTTCVQFNISFTMTVETADGGNALPPVLYSFLPPIVTPYAVYNGLQGVVTVSGRSTAYFSMDYPANVEAQKYPDACGDPTLAAVDVTYMSDGASVFMSQFATQLLPDAPLYNDINDAITLFLGAPLVSLAFGAPKLKVYKPARV